MTALMPANPGSAGMAGMNFAAGSGSLEGLLFRESSALAGLGFDWGVFSNILGQGTQAAAPIIAAGANKIAPGTVAPIYGYTGGQQQTGSIFGGGGVNYGAGGLQVGGGISTGTLLLGGAALLALVFIMRGR